MKTLALTFDDGPAEWTPAILELLGEHDTHATFFMLGCHVPFHDPVLQWAHRAGHDIGNHGWTHAHMGNMSDTQALAELEDTQYRIQAAIGEQPLLWRSPYLSARSETRRLASEKLGIAHVGIDVDPRDYTSSVDAIVDAVRGAPDGSIIGLHDGVPPGGGSGLPDRINTVQATERILQLPGIRFVSVSGLWAKAAA